MLQYSLEALQYPTVILDIPHQHKLRFPTRSEKTTQVDSLIQLVKLDRSFEVKSVRTYLLSSDLTLNDTLQKTDDCVLVPFLVANISVSTS